MMQAHMAKRTTGTQYMLLANNLLQRIDAGEFPPGALLPSELELCEQFNVSRITVRSALKELETRGMVSRRPGIGTRVDRKAQEQAFSHLGANVDDVLRFTKGMPVRVLAARELTLGAPLSQELALAPGQRLVHFEATRGLPGSDPTVYSNHYVPALLAPSREELEGLQESIAQWLADRHGDEVMTIRQKISAVALTRSQAAHLNQKAGSPALKSTRWYHGRDERLILVSVSLFASTGYTFESTLRRSAH